MSIAVDTLLLEKAKRFGASIESEDFQTQFLEAVNYTLDDIDERCGLTTTTVTTTSATIALDRQRYQQVLSMGIDWYLASMGEWTVKLPETLQAQYENKLRSVDMQRLRALDLGVKFGTFT